MPAPFSLFTRIPFWVQILAGLVLGVVLGLVARSGDVAWLSTTLTTVGELFIQLLKLAVPPLVFTAVVASIANLRGVTNAARLAGRTLMWFMATSLLAVVVGLGLGLLTNPGRGVTLDTGAAAAPKHVGTWTDFLTGIIPTNPVGAFVDGNVLQIVFLGAVVGAAALQLGAKAQPFLALNTSVLELVQKALWWVIRLAPLGTLGLIGKAVSQYGWDLLAPLATFTVDVYLGCLIVLGVVYPALLLGFGRLSPRRFYAGAWPAIQLAFVSRSSVGTMPLTQKVTVERLGVPKDFASFAVPFGATTKMDGCAADLPGARGDLRRPGLRCAARRQGPAAHRVRLRRRLRGHRGPDRRYRHADADAQHAGSAAGRRRAAAGRRPDPGHDAHGDQRRRPGPGAGPRRPARGHPGPRGVRRAEG